MSGLVPLIHVCNNTPMYIAYVYILASKKNGTLYIGMTKNLPRRIFEHQNGLIDGFTKRYDVKILVWIEGHQLVTSAIQREKTIKKYSRQWKINLIEENNPEWLDISNQVLEA